MEFKFWDVTIEGCWVVEDIELATFWQQPELETLGVVVEGGVLPDTAAGRLEDWDCACGADCVVVSGLEDIESSDSHHKMSNHMSISDGFDDGYVD